MAGVAGALAAELLGQGDWYEAPQWVSNISLSCGQAGAYIRTAVHVGLCYCLAEPALELAVHVS